VSLLYTRASVFWQQASCPQRAVTVTSYVGRYIWPSNSCNFQINDLQLVGKHTMPWTKYTRGVKLWNRGITQECEWISALFDIKIHNVHLEYVYIAIITLLFLCVCVCVCVYKIVQKLYLVRFCPTYRCCLSFYLQLLYFRASVYSILTLVHIYTQVVCSK